MMVKRGVILLTFNVPEHDFKDKSLKLLMLGTKNSEAICRYVLWFNFQNSTTVTFYGLGGSDEYSLADNIDYTGTTVSSENNFVDGLENTCPGPTSSSMLLIKNYGQPNYSRPNSRSEHRRTASLVTTNQKFLSPSPMSRSPSLRNKISYVTTEEIASECTPIFRRRSPLLARVDVEKSGHKHSSKSGKMGGATSEKWQKIRKKLKSFKSNNTTSDVAAAKPDMDTTGNEENYDVGDKFRYTKLSRQNTGVILAPPHLHALFLNVPCTDHGRMMFIFQIIQQTPYY